MGAPVGFGVIWAFAVGLLLPLSIELPGVLACPPIPFGDDPPIIISLSALTAMSCRMRLWPEC